MDGPRPIKPSEYEATLQLCNSIFHTPGGVQMGLPMLFGEDNRHHLWVVAADGKPVSHIGMAVRPAVIGPLRTRVATLGVVGTYPEYRGRGYASAILQATFDQAASEGADLVLISGGRGLYRRAGCAVVARTFSGEIAPARLPGRGPAPRLYDGDTRPFAALSAAEPVHWVRDEADWQMLLGQNPLDKYDWIRAYVGTARRPVAYVVLKHHHGGQRLTMHEWAGDRRAALQAVRRLARERGCTGIRAQVPDTDTEMLQLLFGDTLPAPDDHGPTVKVVNLPALLAKLPGVPPKLACDGDRDRWVLSLGQEEWALEGDLPGWLVWGHPTGDTSWLPPAGPLRRALGRLFPLPRLPYGLNYV